jgi:hypothetical protein
MSAGRVFESLAAHSKAPERSGAFSSVGDRGSGYFFTKRTHNVMSSGSLPPPRELVSSVKPKRDGYRQAQPVQQSAREGGANHRDHDAGASATSASIKATHRLARSSWSLATPWQSLRARSPRRCCPSRVRPTRPRHHLSWRRTDRGPCSDPPRTCNCRSRGHRAPRSSRSC